MISRRALRFALRNRAATLSVATTGSATLASTANGFSRATGSFLTDGFRLGMPVTPLGFSNNDEGTVAYVSATDLYIAGGRAAQAAGSGRSLTVGLPALRAWENLELQENDVTLSDDDLKGRQYVTDQLISATGDRRTLGSIVEEGRWILTWYFLETFGTDAIDDCTDAVRALFTPGTALLTGSDVVVRGDTITLPSQPQRVEGGWVAVNISIPYRAQSTTAAAA